MSRREKDTFASVQANHIIPITFVSLPTHYFILGIYDILKNPSQFSREGVGVCVYIANCEIYTVEKKHGFFQLIFLHVDGPTQKSECL